MDKTNEGLVKNLFMAYITYKAVKDVFQFAKMNNIVLPGGNMGISRAQMPQIHSDRMQEYMRHLGQNGIKLTKTKMATADVKLTQNEYNKFKVLKLMDIYKKGAAVHPIIVSSDGFVLDGSHRFIAQHNINMKGSIDVLKANVKIKDLLDASRRFAGATFRNVSDKGVDK